MAPKLTEVQNDTMVLFNFYRRKVFSLNNYIFKRSDIAIFTKFAKNYKTTCFDKVFLVDYVETQYQYWIDVYEGTFPETPISFLSYGWVFGEKAFQRFDSKLVREREKKLREGVRTLADRAEAEKLVDAEPPKRSLNSLSSAEESEKHRFLNTDAGLSWCIAYTSLYSPASTNCKSCIFSGSCKAILKEKHPKIYKARV